MIQTNATTILSVCSIQQTGYRGLVVLEFFAGIGLARVGLEAAGLSVAWANDIEADKREMYREHFGNSNGEHYELGDIAEVASDSLPKGAALAWAS